MVKVLFLPGAGGSPDFWKPGGDHAVAQAKPGLVAELIAAHLDWSRRPACGTASDRRIDILSDNCNIRPKHAVGRMLL